MTSPSAREQQDPIRADVRSDHTMVVLAREASSVATAREWMMAFVRGLVPKAQADDAVLVVSELVTNALRHGLGEVVARTSIDHDGSINIAITDSGEDVPTLLPADPARIGGLGLRIIDELAASWGVAPFPGGKTVWATVVAPRA